MAPNPGRPPFLISFPPDGDARVLIVNAAHEIVRTVSGTWLHGSQGYALWDGRDGAGREVASDTYLVVVRARGKLRKEWLGVIQ